MFNRTNLGTLAVFKAAKSSRPFRWIRRDGSHYFGQLKMPHSGHGECPTRLPVSVRRILQFVSKRAPVPRQGGQSGFESKGRFNNKSCRQFRSPCPDRSHIATSEVTWRAWYQHRREM